MKNTKKIILLSAILLLLTAAIVYAQTSTATVEKKDTKTVSAEMINKSSEILSKLDTNTNISKSNVKYDKFKNEDIYEVENSKYFINLDSSNNLVGIYSKEVNPLKVRTKFDKNRAREIIINKYNELNLPSEYDLVYLEKIDDEIWEADFQKNYNGVYNKYEAVKTFFIPENDEIVSLTIFDEGHSNSQATISKDDAIMTAANSLNIDSSEIISAELAMEKANDFYDESNSDTSIHTSWVLQSADNSIVFVDAAENTVIGGDCINE
ncbi:MAG: hypothetical protein HFJ25_03620 [Clostridia bacterium]|nr:hypothetical protein [Clostridia bacterium]